jgi:hypothetical protein
LPPKPRSNFWPKIVSPALGKRSANVTKSIFALPTTAMRGRFAIRFTKLCRKICLGLEIPQLKKAESSQRSRLLSTDFRNCSPQRHRVTAKVFSGCFFSVSLWLCGGAGIPITRRRVPRCSSPEWRVAETSGLRLASHRTSQSRGLRW